MNPRRARRLRRSRAHKQRARVATAIRAAVREARVDMIECGVRHGRVNFGWCMSVAESARTALRNQGVTALTVRDDEELCTSDHEIYGHTMGPWTHEWLWVDGLHYDAEAPMGVRRWLSLPHFQRWLTDTGDPLTDGVVIVTMRTKAEEDDRFHLGAKMAKRVYQEIEAA